MKTVTSWQDRIPEHTGGKFAVHDVAFRPDGTQLIAAVGVRVLVYAAADTSAGDPIHSLKGHKDTVYCVGYSKDGKRFASGGADKMVIIWTPKAEGILKYQHSDSIQCLSYNPVTQQLASATATDFGLWSPEQKSVSKHKVTSKVLACAWTNDGQHLALGHLNGVISIRTKAGDEKLSMKRTAPVWTLTWNPSREEAFDILAVGCWDQTLSFYHLSSKQIGRDRHLGFDPCCVSYFSNGEYILIGGSDKKVSLWTKEGVRLSTIAEVDDWVWSVKQRPKLGSKVSSKLNNTDYIAMGTNDGLIAMYQLIFSTVHGLYQDQYAYRDYMTDVVIQQLVNEKKLKIRCKDYVKKIAIYRDRLAVQLPDKVFIYELCYDDGYEMRHKLKERIQKKLDCNLLVVTSQHIVLCLDRKLILYNFTGVFQRQWVLESGIRYIKPVGGPVECEALLVGLRNGTVLKIFIDNTFPIHLVKLENPVRCLDLSASRNKLAVVDENQQCVVYRLDTRELLFQEANANAIAWNSEYEDMLCFSGNSTLNIKTGNFPVHQQKLQGFVVGFKGSKIFCLHYVSMRTVDVPQSASLYRYLEKKDFVKGYQIACLGVTENDWRMLAMQALQDLNFTIARKAFIRIRDVRYIEFLDQIALDKRCTDADDRVFLAEILAYQGKYEDAAALFCKIGQEKKAIEMYADLKMWTKAKDICPNDENLKDLIRRQARWAEETGSARDAAVLWLAAGDSIKAITLMGENGWLTRLIEVCRQLNKSEVQAIQLCGKYFRKNNAHAYGREAYEKIGDMKSLMQLHVEMQKWDEAFKLLETSQGLADASDVFLPYAEWLALNDKFDDAQEAYKKASRPKEALRMVEQLACNGVTERRYDAAAYYFWKLASEHLRLAIEGGASLSPEERDQRITYFKEYRTRGEIYYAYSVLHKYHEVPFCLTDPLGLFHASRWLLMNIGAVCPYGVSRLVIVLALAKLSKQLEAYKIARTAYEKLQRYVVPNHLIDQLDIAAIQIRSKPFTDKEDVLPMCYRCSFTNPLLNDQGDGCTQCLHPFVRSFCSFDHLPLVQFELSDGISDEEALAILSSNSRLGKKQAGDWKEKNADGVQTLTFTGDDGTGHADMLEVDGGMNLNDPFTRQLMALDFQGSTERKYQPVIVDRETLRQMKRDDIFVVRWTTASTKEGIQAEEGLLPKELRLAYYRNVVPDLPVVLCKSCNHFFHEDDYEFEVLKTGGCPFCRAKVAT
eukprot:TRINITY_DN27556_c0_g1_i1.p1 TRINITY_DN27556_c0_g1~~TRINITY_DN27556_c0_g1_i1.p1  ORF type:complete len:1234 (+),score=571.29 TRINITY_DN27556_c0_g1_i1:232-3933(+)